eukprot:3180833-Pyramimonas_sp.AAC.1
MVSVGGELGAWVPFHEVGHACVMSAHLGFNHVVEHRLRLLHLRWRPSQAAQLRPGKSSRHGGSARGAPWQCRAAKA